MVKRGDETDCRARHEMERPLGCVLTSIGHWIFKIRHPAHQSMISSHCHHEPMITLLGSIQFISWPPNHSRSPPAPQPRFFVTPLALSKGNLHFFNQMCGIIDSLSFMKCWFTKGDPAHLCHVEINQVQHLGRLKMKRLLRNVPFTKRTQDLLSPFSPIQFVLSGQSSQPLRNRKKNCHRQNSPHGLGVSYS